MFGNQRKTIEITMVSSLLRTLRCHGLLLWCIVEFGAVVVQNEMSIMNERRKNKWRGRHSLHITHNTWTNTKITKHSVTYVHLFFDSTVFAVLCFWNLVAPVVRCWFYLLPFMGVISFTIYQHRKLHQVKTMSQRTSKCLRSIKLECTFKQRQWQMYQQI